MCRSTILTSAFQRYVGSRFRWKKVKAAACPVTDRDRAPQNLNKAFGRSVSWRSGFRCMECWGIDICGPLRRVAAADDTHSDNESISTTSSSDVEVYVFTATCVASGYLMTRTM
ncbi:hypothetical protein FOZ61_008160 [Perkinsus olseni]|uniref:Uncharacterized protein n=1 Tax=Perkinsus olseni TaxID=32597 RepID=A0A7J6L606_PEROL|nr:hypothetical protein FOZ61_008160 [Perkinsus olseni]KAF4666835.1 hypothetical protein FOL46_002834 [Perkinsus olseni]